MADTTITAGGKVLTIKDVALQSISNVTVANEHILLWDNNGGKYERITLDSLITKIKYELIEYINGHHTIDYNSQTGKYELTIT